MSTPTRSPVPTQTNPPDGNAFGDITYSMTYSHTDSVTIVPTFSMSYVSSLSHSFYYDPDDEQYHGIFIDTDSKSYIPGSTISSVDGYIINYDNYFLITSVTTTAAPKLDSSLIMIIIIGTVLVALIVTHYGLHFPIPTIHSEANSKKMSIT